MGLKRSCHPREQYLRPLWQLVYRDYPSKDQYLPVSHEEEMEAIKQYQNNTRVSCDTIEVGDLEMQQN